MKARVAWLADPHVGNHRKFGGPMVGSLNERCRLIVDSIRYAATIANEYKCEDLIVAGDLYDIAKPSPQMVGATMRAFRNFNNDTLLLVGNHDLTSTDEHDHAMGSVLADNVGVQACEHPFLHVNGNSPQYSVVMIPFQPGDAREWLPGAVAKVCNPHDLIHEKTALCIHLGVYSSEYVAFVGGDKSRDAVPVSLLGDLMDEHGIDICFAGNWHARKEFKTESGKPIIQIGSLTPTGWNDKGLTGHGMYLWDPATNETEFREIAGPRFVDLPYGVDEQDKALATLSKQPKKLSLYVRGVADGREAMLALADKVRAIGATPNISVDQTIAKAQAKTAAVVARSATTRTDALTKYVRAMALDDDIERSEIRERCTRYLARGTE